MMVSRYWMVVACSIVCGWTPVEGQRPCDPPATDGPSRDLYCIELVPAPGLPEASGRVELGYEPGPFTVAVGPEGRPRSRLTLAAANLPDPSALGDYRAYVAWVASPTMDSAVKHGTVRNGTTRLGIVDWEKFTFLVTAERSAGARHPSGRVVLRGQSPATRLYPPDLLQFSLGALPPPAASLHNHRENQSGTAGDSSLRWTHVPMPPGITMLPAEMALRPEEPAWLPPTDTALPSIRLGERITLRDGDTLQLHSGVGRRTVNGRSYTMYAFNGQHPGPLIEVKRGSRLTVVLNNRLPQPTSIHWHGIRLENPNDGTPGLTQSAVQPDSGFTYQLRFPDDGIYWYHPHVREDLQQELGLYGNLLVRPGPEEKYGPVNQEAVLMLDDLLVSNEGIVPFGRESPTHALMGRFGNVLLVNGEPSYRMNVAQGDVVRFFITNAASARTLNLSFPGARMKVVASDVGVYQQEEWIQNLVIAPAERYVVHAQFTRPGRVPLLNRVRALDHLYGRFLNQKDTVGIIEIGSKSSRLDLSRDFRRLRRNPEKREEMRQFLSRPRASRRTLVLTVETQGLPTITQRLMQLDSIYFTPVEWSGTMPMMNWASTGRQVRWILRDPQTGRENMDLHWRLRRGEAVPIRLVNERRSAHAMQHPIHLHGQRFLVLAVNGEATQNLVWKDTVLVPAGGTVDILLEASNSGRWMAHCHISEHLSSGMMMGFTVE